MQNDDALVSHPLGGPRNFRGARDELLLKALGHVMRRVAKGRIKVTMPSGRSTMIGSRSANGTGVDAAIEIKSFSVFSRAVRRATVGVGESYMNGEWDTPDLGNFFRFFLDNQPDLDRAGRGLFGGRWTEKLAHKRRSNTRAGSRRNIAAHYDLGNTFYAHWLDESMTYSSGLFRDAAMSLQAAQAAKNDAILDALAVKAGDRILEVGCGWGGFAEAAARRGAVVTGITVSNAQLQYGRDRMTRQGLDGSVDLRFEDYRDVKGEFDHLVSIEMIEAVGEAHWPAYFAMIRDRLRPGGKAVIQAITIGEADFPMYRQKPDFIQAFIFPGGMLPTVSLMRDHAAAVGLRFTTIERFGATGYVPTLRMWRDRFERAWPEIAQLGFDERFRRMWLYYLTYCEVAFERGAIDVGIYRLDKPMSRGT